MPTTHILSVNVPRLFPSTSPPTPVVAFCRVLDTYHWFSMSQAQYGCSYNGPLRGP